jgi:hypothetical protein
MSWRQTPVTESGKSESVAESGKSRERRRRRVTTQPVPGTDPSPAAEPDRHTLTENDERLKAEKPPHY